MLRPVVILGGGIAGLSTAYHLDRLGVRYELYEAESRVGGLCRTEIRGRYRFDYGGHMFHSSDAQIERQLRGWLGGDLIEHERQSRIYSHGVLTKYPFQAHLYGLPGRIVDECLDGFRNRPQDGAKPDATLKEWVIGQFGEGIARHFMLPYNRKLWKVPLEELVPEVISRFVPPTDEETLRRGAAGDLDEELGYNVHFLYPRSGGAERLPEAMARGLKGINLESRVVGLSIEDRELVLESGQSVGYESLVSTIPLPKLVELISQPPSGVRQAVDRLRWVGVSVVNLGVSRPHISPFHWIYVPEEEFLGHRIGIPSILSPAMAPEGRSSVCVEISWLPEQAPYGEEASLVERSHKDLITMGLLKSSDGIDVELVLHLPFAYVIYDRGRSGALSTIGAYLEQHRIHTIGRFGAWYYACVEDVIKDGQRAADASV